MKYLLRWMLGLFALTAVACGSAAAGNSCSIASNGAVTLCMDFGADIPMSVVTASCVSPGGSATATAATTACPTANRVGSCAVTSAGGTITYRYYAPYTTADAMSACQMSGMGTGVTAVFSAN